MNQFGGFVGGQYAPLTESDIKKINDAALTVLERAGLMVGAKTGRRAFKAAGAVVDEATRVVKIPRGIVEDAIASAPRSLVLYGRQSKYDIPLEDKKVYCGTGGTALYVLDLETGERRPSETRDVRMNARLTDALENVHLFTINVYPNEIKELNEVDINRFYHSIMNTSKHVMGGVYSLEGAKQAVEMASIVAGGRAQLKERPFISFITLMISPLKVDDLYGEITCYLAMEGLPVVTPSEPLCGATSPVTLAGNLVIHCAESLAGVTLVQLINKGAPVIFGSVGSITDMRTMSHVSGAIERGMLNAAMAQMAHYYELPYYSTGGMSDSKLVDAQAGFESSMGLLLVMMAGANYIHDAAGLMEFDLTVSYEKMVIDNEIIGMCNRVLKGIEVNDDMLATDLICSVGPGGDFMSELHTVEHMRSEFFFPKVADRDERETWRAKGAKNIASRAREIAIKLLKEHKPEPLDRAIDKAIRAKFPAIRDVND